MPAFKGNAWAAARLDAVGGAHGRHGKHAPVGQLAPPPRAVAGDVVAVDGARGGLRRALVHLGRVGDVQRAPVRGQRDAVGLRGTCACYMTLCLACARHLQVLSGDSATPFGCAAHAPTMRPCTRRVPRHYLVLCGDSATPLGCAAHVPRKV